MSVRSAGKILLVQRSALAQAVVARLYHLYPILHHRYGDQGRSFCLQDTEYHLAYLASALLYSSRRLFEDYIHWVKTLFAARHLVQEDVEHHLECLWSVLQEQLPSALIPVVQPYLEDAFRVQPQADANLPSLLAGEDELSILAQLYLKALLAADRTEASRLIRQAHKAGVPLADLYLHIFQRTQREIGRLWQLNQVSIAQEHYCSAATQVIMAQLHSQLFALPRNGRFLAATSVAGELHEIGLRLVCDLFESRGWNTVYFGANQPAQSLLQACCEHSPQVLAISATMAYHLPAVEDLISLVRSEARLAKLKILVGGYPFNVDPDLWRRLGADGHADNALTAISIAEQLVNQSPDSTRPSGPRPLGLSFPGLHRPRTLISEGEEVSRYDELTRMNNDVLTLQRELSKKNADLEREIRERKHAEDSAWYLAGIVAGARDAIVGFTSQGIISSWNAGAEKLYGYREEEALGEPAWLIVPPELQEDNRSRLERVAADQPVEAIETVRQRKDGTRLPVLVSISPVKDRQGRVVGLAEIGQDLSRIKQLEEQARRARELESIGRLAGGVAQSFNNLMTTVLSQCEIILGGLKPRDPLFAPVVDIKRAGARTAALTQKLLAFSRQQMLTPQSVDLNVLLLRLRSTLQPMLGRIRLDLNLAKQSVSVLTDQDQMEEGILSLVRHALNAMPDGGGLTIRTGTVRLEESYQQTHPELRSETYGLLSISHTGNGMTEEQQEHLFEPFSCDCNQDFRYAMALAAVYGFIKQCGGEISVESDPSKGTTFFLYLPLCPNTPV